MTCNSERIITSEQFMKEVQKRQSKRTDCRLRERFVEDHGFGSFNDAEILTMLLSYSAGSCDNARLADSLLDSFGSLKGVLEARPEQLMAVEGMNSNKARLISLAIPLAKAWIGRANEELIKLSNNVEACDYCRKLLMGERVEIFFVIALNAQNRVIGRRKISTGSIGEVNAYPRLIMETALNYNASSVILCHNHPGGTDNPSSADISTTKTVQQLLQGVGIDVLDHIIVAGEKTYSMIQHRDISYCYRRCFPEKKESKDLPSSDPREKNKACSRSKDKEVSVMPYNRKALGVVISKLRVEKGLTQETLSGLAGISRSHLAALENGEKTVKLDTLWRIADALGTGPAALIWRTEAESITLQKERSK